MVDPTDITTIIEAIAVVPDTDWVACIKISRKEYPVGVVKAASRFPIPRQVTIRIANPMTPLIIMLVIIDLGTFTDGFSTSSDIYVTD